MKLAFWRKKTELPRGPDGKFTEKPSAPLPQQTNIPMEKAVTRDLNTLDTLLQATATVDKLVESRMSMLGVASDAPHETEGITAVIRGLELFAPYVGPYIPAIFERFGLKPQEAANPSPAASPQQAAAEKGEDITSWLKRASGTPPAVIRPFLPALEGELTKRNIDVKEFKQAIKNINEAYGQK